MYIDLNTLHILFNSHNSIGKINALLSSLFYRKRYLDINK